MGQNKLSKEFQIETMNKTKNELFTQEGFQAKLKISYVQRSPSQLKKTSLPK